MLEYRNLGRTGVKISNLALGCDSFGGRIDAPESFGIIDRALDAGINLLDTAGAYPVGNARRSEEVVGEALARNGTRNAEVLGTKYSGGTSRRHIITQCEASLRRLGTDYIDLYQAHFPGDDVPIDETLRALGDLIRAGKVRYIGACNFAAWGLVESLWVSKELGLNRVVSAQPNYNLLKRRAELELLPMAQTFGLAVIPFSPLAGGLLTGKYERGAPAPADSRYGQTFTWPFGKAALNERVCDAVDQLEAIAREKGVPLSQLALAWCMQQPGITSPIMGARTVAQLEDNLAARAIEVSAEELQRIDETFPRGNRMGPPLSIPALAPGPPPYRAIL